MLEDNQTNEVSLLRNEVERYKSLYEQEREQFIEFQRYSKELETELDMELSSLKKKVSELDKASRRAINELENYKSRYDKERKEFLGTENHLRSKLNISEENCKDMKQKLRRVEQLNDDLERRERIQAQELLDWANRYEKCLERYTYLEAGVINGETEEAESNGSMLSSEVLADRTNLLQQSIISSSSPLNSPTSTNHKSIDAELSALSNSNNLHKTEISCNGFHGFGSLSKKNFSSSHSKERPSSAIVSSLFRKIEEVEKQVDPKKYIIHRTPNRK